MNKIQNKHGVDLKTGQAIKGKWHQQHYVIKKKLGSGTVGTVYLCETGGKPVALKISEQSASIITEVNVLKALQKVQGSSLGPRLLDVDDWVFPSSSSKQIFSFYVMEYIRGEDIGKFIKQNGIEWAGVFLLQLLSDLERLHGAGWVFGDLKKENLLVASSPTKVRLIDVGGTTQIGRAIKEYTEFYDRGYWGLGTRKAEPAYDLFSLAMVFVSIFYPRQFPRTPHAEKDIIRYIQAIPALRLYHYCLEKAILGQYASSTEMKQDLLKRFQMKGQTRQSRNKGDQNVIQKIPLLIEVGGILLIAATYFASSLLF